MKSSTSFEALYFNRKLLLRELRTKAVNCLGKVFSKKLRTKAALCYWYLMLVFWACIPIMYFFCEWKIQELKAKLEASS